MSEPEKPKTERKTRLLAVMLVIIAAVTLAVIWGRSATALIQNNQQRAIAACKSFAEAEEIYHRIDYSGSGALYYAKQLSWLYSQNQVVYGLISQEFANAELAPGPGITNNG